MYSHIYNISAIVALIKVNKDEKNLYQKVTNMIKGASVGSLSLRDEVVQILLDEQNKLFKQLQEKSNVAA